MNIIGHVGIVVIAFGLSPQPILGTVAPDILFIPTLIHDLKNKRKNVIFIPYEGISLKIHLFLHSIYMALIMGFLTIVLQYFQINISGFLTGWCLHVFADWFTHGGKWYERAGI